MSNWQNFLFITAGICFILLVSFGIYLFFKVYTIKDVVYCVYDDRDVYENLAIGSLEECQNWVSAVDDPEDLGHLHVTLYFEWKFRRNKSKR